MFKGEKDMEVKDFRDIKYEKDEGTDDFREALKARAGKRPPSFKGR